MTVGYRWMTTCVVMKSSGEGNADVDLWDGVGPVRLAMQPRQSVIGAVGEEDSSMQAEGNSMAVAGDSDHPGQGGVHGDSGVQVDDNMRGNEKQWRG